MEGLKLSLLALVLVLGVNVNALKCYDGSLFFGWTEVKCAASDKFCVLWSDYSSQDYYAFCDESNLCQASGFKNYTYYGVGCCDSDDCNDIPQPVTLPVTFETTTSDTQTQTTPDSNTWAEYETTPNSWDNLRQKLNQILQNNKN